VGQFEFPFLAGRGMAGLGDGNRGTTFAPRRAERSGDLPAYSQPSVNPSPFYGVIPSSAEANPKFALQIRTKVESLESLDQIFAFKKYLCEYFGDSSQIVRIVI
jgi:hypothetical protein